MATYAELHELHSNGILLDKIDAAIAKSAQTIVAEDIGTENHAARLIWAAGSVSNIRSESKRFLPLVIAANSGATVEQITDASDVDIQENIDSFVNLFATGA